ncbi:hypothetical protein HIM_03423 [Hirsutella minnesotensis 3608]|uniref:Uncharacterized protein n=1 Tax=Hirsutella minnesotensis 3608 TaxID=1043627 RepID=A0A0F8A2M2_9HYPO|nr:hypothetical protein HIM_03423 [Hirsutella minnesotensis 3608]
MASSQMAGSLAKRDCSGGSCEKSISTNVTNIAIVVGVVVPLIVGGIVLFFLHRRNVRRLKLEDASDPNKGLDFGLDDAPMKSSKRKSMFGIEKTAHKPGQLSMDMNLSSPYLLPPGAHQSHDSIHSLARTFPNEIDPYRTIKEYTHSENGSIRSFNPAKDASLRVNSKRNSTLTSKSATLSPQPTSATRSPVSSETPVDPFATPTASQPTHGLPAAADAPQPSRPTHSIVPEIGTVVYPDDKVEGGLEIPDVRRPPAALTTDSRPGPPSSPPRAVYEPYRGDMSSNIGVAQTGDDEFHFETGPVDMAHVGVASMPEEPTLPDIMFGEPHAVAGDPGMAHSYDGYAPAEAYPEIQTTYAYDGYEEETRGRGMGRQALEEHPAPAQQSGLGVPQQQAKRLSVGFRPLPPDEVTESEDPEYRANRIRSFYKEYFEDTKEAPPPLPTHRPMPQYEDYDENFLGDAAYYDAETNAFVMPYAQPVTRRAMTPPPAPRFRGGPGPRSSSRGPRGPPGPGSMVGMGYRPRAGSAATPRPGSSASARVRGPPRKRLPPPAELKTLPTPSKLRDDSFAIMNAVDFAPPVSFEERAAGRSQSPLGERRPYLLKRPVVSPLATAFDELSVLPSPHLLRKSSTFTNLDFAPPKKFKDADTMSDAGSIRSNRSGISAVQLDAIRSGAGRVSRLPGDTVFTAAAITDQLKPQWGMRP